jgi:hypothetical protein
MVLTDEPPMQAPPERLVPIAGREPTAVPAEWRDPDDLNPNRRAARVVQGTRAVDPVYAAHLRAGSKITLRHVRAANKYLTDYEMGILGSRPNAPERVGGTRAAGAMYPSEEQCARVRSILIAHQALGAAATQILRHVVLGIPDPLRRDAASYARRFGMDPKLAMGLLVAALERLAEHYQIGEK